MISLFSRLAPTAPNNNDDQKTNNSRPATVPQHCGKDMWQDGDQYVCSKPRCKASNQG